MEGHKSIISLPCVLRVSPPCPPVFLCSAACLPLLYPRLVLLPHGSLLCYLCVFLSALTIVAVISDGLRWQVEAAVCCCTEGCVCSAAEMKDRESLTSSLSLPLLLLLPSHLDTATVCSDLGFFLLLLFALSDSLWQRSFIRAYIAYLYPSFLLFVFIEFKHSVYFSLITQVSFWLQTSKFPI